ncbi:MAG: nitroreductase family protein [Anaerolineae bacterium]|nr:nitroreductase family protein [Anaerolineae bacterium]
MSERRTVPLSRYGPFPPEEMQQRAAAYYAELRLRRSVRAFSDQPVPRAVIDDCLRTAGTAPSGANMQPWHFVVVADPAVKRRIREAAEETERAFYERRASEEWLGALAPLGTDPHKPFLEQAPYLIAILAQRYGLDVQGHRVQHYYVTRSVGIATGFLIAAVHHAGLAALPYTPSPMGFLSAILDRPANERPFLLLAVGYPAPGVTVPEIDKKPLDEIVTYV